MKNFLLVNVIAIMLFSSLGLEAQTIVNSKKIREYSIDFYDSSRQRLVPVAIYSPTMTTGKQVIIFNHGYGENKGDSYKQYTHITRQLASEDYFVISIQHELPTDEPLAMEGNIYKNRLPNWERGVANILFVIEEFKKLKPELNWSKMTVIGHSNGGDIAMMFAGKYPSMLNKAISLDNRRMPLPLASSPRIYSLRSSDYPADKGVLPSQKDQNLYGIKIIDLDIKHSEMDDDASEEQSKIINDYLLLFLKENR